MKEIELVSKRGRREKHFLREDGSFVARMYSDDVHFEKNGKYEEINNHLKSVGDYYKNIRNSFNVYLAKKSDKEILKYELPQGSISFELLNNVNNVNNVDIKILRSDSKYLQTVKYENILDGIDFIYNILPTKIKENIIINNKESIIEKICFKVKTSFDLKLNNEGYIDAFENGEIVFSLDPLLMFDSKKKVSHNINYKLVDINEYYLLELIPDLEWLNDENTEYPVTIDPIITTRNTGEVYDTYIYPGDTNINRNGQDILKAGVERINGNDVINRSLIKFELPTIGTGSQIIEANLNLVSYVADSEELPYLIQRRVDIHRVTTDWNESTANWLNMNNKYDSRIEVSFLCSRSFEEHRWEGDTITTTIIPSYGIANITSLVKKWYEGTPNYGIMLMAHNEVYDSEKFPAFYSKNNTVTGENPKPSLEIVYRNQNGLENYTNYQVQTFDGGIVYENLFNGNLISVFDVGGTKNNKLPIDLKIVYNTNDAFLNNNYGLGVGFKFNLYQTIKPETISGTNYLQYLDDDGTLHYFVLEDGIYKDEDNLNMTIVESENNYILKDKYNNQTTFSIKDGVGYLTEIKDVEGNTINVTYNSTNLITEIVDSDNQVVNVQYESNKITIISPNNTTTLNYNEFLLNNILNLYGNIFFEYNEYRLLSKIIDIDGTSYGYEYYSQKPYRLKKIIEYGINDKLGTSIDFIYGIKSTTLIDNKNQVTTINFNDQGNPINTTNLKSKEDILDAYGIIDEYGENSFYKNKLMSHRIPVRHVKNYLKNISFEKEKIYFQTVDDVEISISDDCANSGDNSLKIVSINDDKLIKQNVSVPKGAYYTFSTYVKNNNDVKIGLSYINSNNDEVEKISELISNDEFNRYNVTINYPEDAVSDLIIKIYLLTKGTIYIDDVQLEDGEVANNFNYVENSDFSDGFDDIIFNSSAGYNNWYELVTLLDGKTKALRIKMDPAYPTSLSKYFNFKGEAGEEFCLSFWYKNNGTIPYSTGLSGSATWMLAHYTENDNWDTLTCVPTITLNPSQDEWQYFSYSFVTAAKYDGFEIFFEQEGDANDLYITNISLFKGVSSSKFDYDSSGDLTSAIGHNGETTNFNYDLSNQIVNTKMSNGNILFYEYDNKVLDRLKNTISKTGIYNEVKYDLNGNSIVEKISKKGAINNLSNGIYKIRLKGNDLYLRYILDSIQFKDDCSCSGCWKIEKVDNDYYKISHSLIKNKYFTVYNNKIELSTFNDDKSLFMIVRNNNGSYSIFSKSDNKYIKYNNNILELSNFVTDDPSFQFFFETTDEAKFIETDKIYTEDGKYIKDFINTSFSKLSYDFDTETGLIKNTINARNQLSVYEYDDKEQLMAISFGKRKVNYIYNSQNLLSKIIYGKKEYNFTYDEYMNNKSLKIGNNITLLTDQYENNNGNLMAITYGNGDYKNYTYDEFDRIKTITEMDKEHDFKYGSSGNLLKVITNGDETQFAYDLGNRLTEYKNNNYKFQNEYDTSNNIIRKKYVLNNFEEEINNTFNEDNALIKMNFDDNEANYIYDKLGRLINSNINDIVVANYEYQTYGNRTSALINKIILNDNCYYYKFNKLNNITHVYHNGVLENRYYYNEYNELIKEDNYLMNKTFKYGYDYSGNLMFKNEYELNTNNYIKGFKYKYDNEYWEDQLTNFDGENILYDEIGNPIYIGNEISLNWINGNQLSSYSDNEKTINYKYDYTNTRISKVVNGVETKYFNDSSRIVLEKTGNNVLYYIYNDVDDLIGFKYNNELYYYLKNYQNDVIAILNNVGDVIANYIYDSFGNTISIKDSNGDEITDNSSVALINPFRYRSYYFDKETNLYYLNNRYYNPKWGRFLNADGVLLQSSSLSGYNLYTYTNNNFINNVDETGYAPSSLTSIVSQMTQIGSQVASQIANKNNSNEYKQASGLGSLALGGALSSMSDDLLALLKLIFGKAFIAILFISCQLKITRFGQNITQKKFARLHRRDKIFSSVMIRLVKLK